MSQANIELYLRNMPSVSAGLGFLRQNLDFNHYADFMAMLGANFNICESELDSGEHILMWYDENVIDDVSLEEARDILPDIWDEFAKEFLN